MNKHNLPRNLDYSKQVVVNYARKNVGHCYQIIYAWQVESLMFDLKRDKTVTDICHSEPI